MFKKILNKILELNGYNKRRYAYRNSYSVLNSKEYVLEERQSKEKIIELIQKLRAFDIGKELVRVGPSGDGGYLVPDDLTGIKACFSPGVSGNSSFEKHCYNLGMELFLADKSVTSANLSVKHDFIPKYIGSTNNDTFITVDEWVNKKFNKDGDLLLQMDIEGAEYSSFINMSNSLLCRFRIMVIEFHHLHKLWTKSSFNLLSEVFLKILQTHTCVHIHPNNCCGIDVQEGIEIPRVAEFTFIRNDRFSEKKEYESFPHPLDVDNTKYPPLVLPQLWFKDYKVV